MKVLLRKILNLMIALLIVTLLTFLALQVIPGKMLGADATAAQAAQLRARLGLDQPVLVRYGRWLLSFLKGDPGMSYSYSMPVAEMLKGKLSVTVILTALSFAMTVFISIPLGILTARSESVRVNHFFLIMDQLFMALPPFFIGILSVYLFGIVLKCGRGPGVSSAAGAGDGAPAVCYDREDAARLDPQPDGRGLCANRPFKGADGQPDSAAPRFERCNGAGCDIPCAGCCGNHDRNHHHRAGFYDSGAWAAASVFDRKPGFPGRPGNRGPDGSFYHSGKLCGGSHQYGN